MHVRHPPVALRIRGILQTWASTDERHRRAAGTGRRARGARRAPGRGARRDGRGRLVLVAGEAGIGKTSLVRAFCGGAGAARVLWGACDALHTPRALGPARRHRRRDAGGELARRSSTAAPRPAPSSRRCARAARARPGDRSCSRTCTGPTRRTLDVAAPARAAASSRCRRSCSATYRDDELDARPPAAGRARRAAAPGADAARARAALAEARSPRSRGRRRASTPAELHRRTGGNPFFVTEVLAATAAARSRRRCATRCWPAPRGSTTGARALLDAVAIEPAARRAVAARGAGRRRPRTRLDAVPGLGHAARRARRRRASATRSRASRSTRRCAPHRPRCALHRARARGADRGVGRAPRPRAPRPPRRGGRRRRGRAALRAGRRRARRRRSAPTARRPRSSRARAALRRRAARRPTRASCWSAGPTSAT